MNIEGVVDRISNRSSSDFNAEGNRNSTQAGITIDKGLVCNAASLNKKMPLTARQEGDRIFENCILSDRWPGGRYLTTAFFDPPQSTGIKSIGPDPENIPLSTCSKPCARSHCAQPVTGNAHSIRPKGSYSCADRIFKQDWDGRPITCHNFVVLRPNGSNASVFHQQAAKFSGSNQSTSMGEYSEGCMKGGHSWQKISFDPVAANQPKPGEYNQNQIDSSTSMPASTELTNVTSALSPEGACSSHEEKIPQATKEILVSTEEETPKAWWLQDERAQSPDPLLLHGPVAEAAISRGCSKKSSRRIRPVPVVQLEIDDVDSEILTLDPEVPSWPLFLSRPVPQHSASWPITYSHSKDHLRYGTSSGHCSVSSSARGNMPFKDRCYLKFTIMFWP